MKKSLTKLITSCAAVMAVTAAMAVSASAAEYANGNVDLTEITALPSAGQNTVLVIEGTKDDLDAAIKDTTKIKYINQASAADAAGWLNALPVGTDLDVDGKTYTVFMGGEDVKEILSEEFGKSTQVDDTEEVLLGNVDRNKRGDKDLVNGADAVLILKHSAGTALLTDDDLKVANVDKNKRGDKELVNGADAVLVLKHSAGTQLITEKVVVAKKVTQ